MFESVVPLLDAGIQLATMFVLAISPVLVKAFIAWLERKTALDFAAAQEDRVEQLLEQAIHYADESARKRLNVGEKEPGEPGYKMTKALAFAAKEAERMGIKSLVEQGAEHLADKLEARLGVKRHDPNDKIDKVPSEEG